MVARRSRVPAGRIAGDMKRSQTPEHEVRRLPLNHASVHVNPPGRYRRSDSTSRLPQVSSLVARLRIGPFVHLPARSLLPVADEWEALLRRYHVACRRFPSSRTIPDHRPPEAVVPESSVRVALLTRAPSGRNIRGLATTE